MAVKESNVSHISSLFSHSWNSNQRYCCTMKQQIALNTIASGIADCNAVRKVTFCFRVDSYKANAPSVNTRRSGRDHEQTKRVITQSTKAEITRRLHARSLATLRARARARATRCRSSTRYVNFTWILLRVISRQTQECLSTVPLSSVCVLSIYVC